jgi:hypothetical protein
VVFHSFSPILSSLLSKGMGGCLFGLLVWLLELKCFLAPGGSVLGAHVGGRVSEMHLLHFVFPLGKCWNTFVFWAILLWQVWLMTISTGASFSTSTSFGGNASLDGSRLKEHLLMVKNQNWRKR